MLTRNILLIISIFCITVLSHAQDKFYIYSDQFDNGQPGGRMGAWGAKSMKIDPACTDKPLFGTKCAKISVDGSEPWCGAYVQASGTWKEGAGANAKFQDLSPYKYLIINARSDADYTLAKMGFGEASEPHLEEKDLPLTSEWKTFVFELNGLDLKSINGTFLFVFTKPGTVYFDEIYYSSSYTAKENDIVFKRRAGELDSNKFYVYADKWENGIPTGFMGDGNGASINMNDNCRENPYLGPKCIKFQIDNKESWRGIDIQYTGAWNQAVEEDKPLPDLRKYNELVFYARTDQDDIYLIQSYGFAAGGGWEEGKTDSYIEVGKEWKEYRLKIKNSRRERVNTLFRILMTEGSFYIDEIHFR